MGVRLVQAAAIATLVFSGYFFILSVDLMAREPPRVAAGLLAALIGFALLSTSASLFKALAARSVEGQSGS